MFTMLYSPISKYVPGVVYIPDRGFGDARTK